jgi:cholesterol oxidase
MAVEEFDYIIIGSGFGGSVSALRLSEKGYRVLVLEKGKNYSAQDFPKTNWNVRKYLWIPIIKCFGIQKMTLFRDVLILSGVGVGGGSLVYANTLLQPTDEFFKAKSWADLDHWKSALEPHYQTAKKMLGVAKNPYLNAVDKELLKVAQETGREHTFKSVDVAVYFSEKGLEEKIVPDPYFNGEGPERAGCNFCGGCMVGCRFNAKNTLDKNYLYLAQKKNCVVKAEREVVDIRPLSENGENGYEVHAVRSTSWFLKDKQIYKAKGIVLAGGVLGSVALLFRLRDITKSLPKISQRLGFDVRTNSEALIGVTTKNSNEDWSKGIAIASGFYPDEHTHVEAVRYSVGSSFMRFLAVPMVDLTDGVPRFFQFLYRVFRHPTETFFLIKNRRWSQSTVILLVMQSLDNKMKIVRRWSGLSTDRTSEEIVPSYIPAGHKVARHLAQNTNGIPQSAVNEVLLQIPTTAHILGGCGIGATSASGVIDRNQKLFNYKNFYVCDGSAIPANLGVNPSLTITAMTEYAMSKIPKKI